jgi:hypothetical protein
LDLLREGNTFSRSKSIISAFLDSTDLQILSLGSFLFSKQLSFEKEEDDLKNSKNEFESLIFIIFSTFSFSKF